MYWDAKAFRWKTVGVDELATNLRSLVDGNPLIASKSALRPCGCSVDELRRGLLRSIVEFTTLNFASLQSLESDAEIQAKLEREITRYLVFRHYEFVFKSPLSSCIPVTLQQFWWVASFYTCRKETVGATTRVVMHYLDSVIGGRSFLGDEFYGVMAGKRRHASVVTKMLGPSNPGGKCYLMVPFSHSPDQRKGNIKVIVKEGRQDNPKYAQCRSYFRVNGAMLQVEYIDPLSTTISAADFRSIVTAIDDLLNDGTA